MHLLDVDALLVGVELQDELLQVEEGPLVPCMLPYLQQVLSFSDKDSGSILIHRLSFLVYLIAC